MPAKTLITTNIKDHLALIKRVPFFKHLTLAEATLFLQEKAKLVSYQGNQIIFHEGEIGDYMYIVVSGAVDIFFPDRQSGIRRMMLNMSTIKKGEYFGERSLLPDETQTRVASAKAMVTSTLLRISREDFLSVLKHAEKNKKKTLVLEPERDFEIIALLRQNRLFQCMEMDEVIHYRDWSRVVDLIPSEILFRENAMSNCLYFIIEGVIDIYVVNGKGIHQSLKKFSEGRYFGEQSIMPDINERRNANARAETDALLLAIPKLQFHKILQRDRKLEQALKFVGQKQAAHRKKIHAHMLRH